MKIYTCPMHPEIQEKEPGNCPICGMKLVLKSETIKKKENTFKAFLPLFVIVGLIFATALTVSYPQFELKNIVTSFMAGFFIVFAGFKLIDLKGFSQGYRTYDILAKRWNAYGYIYPFIELFFGLSMILALYEAPILVAEIIVMTFSGIGVLQKLMRRERFSCVCLGTFLKIPLTKITLVEDFGMAFLACLSLILR